MKTETTKQDYEIAREELNELFASLKLQVNISEPFGVCDNDWPCIRYTVTINGEPFTYSLGVGHVDWRKPYELIKNDYSDFHFRLFKYSKRLIGQHDAETIRAYCEHKKFRENNSQRIAETAARIAQIQKVAPNPAEVLACVCREGVDADESFANWCANFGSDPDSITALNTYNVCTANGKKARRILGNVLFLKMAELSGRL